MIDILSDIVVFILCFISLICSYFAVENYRKEKILWKQHNNKSENFTIATR